MEKREIREAMVRMEAARKRILHPYFQKLGLTPGQPRILNKLFERDHVSQRELADYCNVDPSAICRMLDSMERAGFLVRKPSLIDRRSGRVEITQQGEQTLAAWEEQCMTIEEQMLRGFSPEEREQLTNFLERAYRNVGGRFLEGGK